jgi:hypothetical protein
MLEGLRRRIPLPHRQPADRCIISGEQGVSGRSSMATSTGRRMTRRWQMSRHQDRPTISITPARTIFPGTMCIDVRSLSHLANSFRCPTRVGKCVPKRGRPLSLALIARQQADSDKVCFRGKTGSSGRSSRLTRLRAGTPARRQFNAVSTARAPRWCRHNQRRPLSGFSSRPPGHGSKFCWPPRTLQGGICSGRSPCHRGPLWRRHRR